MKRIIGIVGPIASGKDTAAEYIGKKLNIPIFSLGDVLRDEARKRDIAITRQNLIDLGRKLNVDNGEDYLSRTVFKNVNGNAIVLGMRAPGDVAFLQNNSSFFVISVDADQKVRFTRLSHRVRTDDPTTFEEFQRLEKEDDTKDNFQRLSECMKLAKYKILNEKSEEELFKEIDKILKKEKLV